MPEADRELELLREGVEILRRQGRVDEAVRLSERIRSIQAEREAAPRDAPDGASAPRPSGGSDA